MPGLRDVEGWEAERQGEAFDRDATSSVHGESVRHTGHELGARGREQRLAEAGHHERDLPAQAAPPELDVDRPTRDAAPRNDHVPLACEALQGRLAPCERVAAAHDGDEPIAEQRLHPDLGAERTHHPEVEIDPTVTQRLDVLFAFGREAQRYARRRGGHALHEARCEGAGEGVACTNREAAFERGEGHLAGRGDERVRLFHHGVHPLAQRQRPSGRHQAAARAHQDRIVEGEADARERPAHGGRGDVKTAGRAGHTALAEEGVERAQEAEVDGLHGEQLSIDQIALFVNSRSVYPGSHAPWEDCMGRNERVLASIADPQVRTLLTRLHGEADGQTLGLVLALLPQLPKLLLGRKLRWERYESVLADKYIPLEPAQGMLCYLLARSLRARHIVEFGTSFGISTIYLALAARDNGGGRVIGTELVPAKAARAREHLREAGLADFVEIREGNALDTLRSLDAPVDFFLNDGFPRFALDVLKLVAPRLREGAMVLTDNVGLFRGDYAGYLSWVRDPANGFSSGVLALKEDAELSVRVARG